MTGPIRTAARPAPARASTRLFVLAVAGVVVVIIGLVIFATPTVILLMAGMCPTALVALVEPDPAKLRTQALGAMNLAGLWPSLLHLWLKGGTFEAMQGILSDPMAWLAIYGAATGGLVLLWLGPWIAAGCLTVARKHAAGQLNHAQRALEKEWGRAVALSDRPDT